MKNIIKFAKDNNYNYEIKVGNDDLMNIFITVNLEETSYIMVKQYSDEHYNLSTKGSYVTGIVNEDECLNKIKSIINK